MWAGTYSDGLFKINQKNEITRYDSKSNMFGIRISKIFEDSNKNLWVGTNGTGVFKYLRGSNEFINYKYNLFNNKSINSDKVWSLMEDKDGLLWFGTLSNGINIYSNRKNEFKRLINNFSYKNSIIGNYIKSLFIDSFGKLWIGTQNGISILSQDKTIRNLSVESGLKVNDIRAIYERRNGEIWIGSWGGGINILDPANSRFNYLLNNPANENSLADNYLRCILEVDDQIYIGTERGLNEYNPKTNKFKLYKTEENDSTSISEIQVTYLLNDSNDNFWVGTSNGLNLFDRKNGHFKRIVISNSDLIPQRIRIRKIFEDSKGNIWLGTLGAGFAKYNFRNNEFQFYNQSDGLSNNTVFEIIEDNEGYLWITTSIGLNKFNPKTQKFVVYKVEDGLPNNEFNSGAAVKDRDGILYLGGVNGLTYFNPSSLNTNLSIPSIEFTKVLVNGNDFDPHGFYNKITSINLPYDKNFIEITFTALDYFNSKSIIYKYKLDGLNEYWVNSGNRNTAVFTNLSHGEYLFRVKCADKFGVWNNEEKSIRIIISPPWWDTNIARMSYLVLLAILIYLIFKIRTNTLRRKHELLEKLVNERTNDLQQSKKLLQQAVTAKDKLFSIISHDLKNPFVALLGYSEILKKNITSLSYEEQQESIDGIYNSANSVYSLLQNLLAWSRLQLNNIECSPVLLNVSEVIETVFNIFSITAANKSITLVNNIKDKTFIFADQNMIEIVFRNIISNSIKFTSQYGKVEISSITRQNNIEIIIEDNGIGVDEETLFKLKTNTGHQLSLEGTSKEKGTGIGIMLVKDLVSRNNGIFNIESTRGKGTKISIIFQKLK